MEEGFPYLLASKRGGTREEVVVVGVPYLLASKWGGTRKVVVVEGLPYLPGSKRRETRVVVVPPSPSDVEIKGGGGGGFPQPSGVEMVGNVEVMNVGACRKTINTKTT